LALQLAHHLVQESNMQIIAVDFSLNSPGIFLKSEEGSKFISYLKTGGTKAEIRIQEELATCKDITLQYQPGFETSKEFSEKEMSKLTRYMTSSDEIISIIRDSELIEPFKPTIVAFEGVSYGSGGGGTNNLIDLAAGAAIFKLNLYRAFSPLAKPFNIVTVAPTSIKKFAGGGRMNKKDLWDAFTANSLGDKTLESSEVWKFAKGLEVGTKVPKPFDDLVDAYFLAQYISSL
jgi:hypothetical protein